jgi:hypothetical protein
MNLIAIGMNLLLAGLLVAAMVVGLRLNKRLKALRDSHEGFEAAVVHLNMAARRAEQGLADLRAATDEATDMLSDRIEKGRDLAAKLERLVSAAPELPRAAAQAERPQPRGMPSVSPPARSSAGEDRLGALLAMARSRLLEKEAAQTAPERVQPEPAPRAAAPAPRPALTHPLVRPAPAAAEPLAGRAPPQGRRLSTFDDDLFDDEPLTLDRFAGGGR